jgi:hypothetical protein
VNEARTAAAPAGQGSMPSTTLAAALAGGPAAAAAAAPHRVKFAVGVRHSQLRLPGRSREGTACGSFPLGIGCNSGSSTEDGYRA